MSATKQALEAQGEDDRLQADRCATCDGRGRLGGCEECCGIGRGCCSVECIRCDGTGRRQDAERSRP